MPTTPPCPDWQPITDPEAIEKPPLQNPAIDATNSLKPLQKKRNAHTHWLFIASAIFAAILCAYFAISVLEHVAAQQQLNAIKEEFKKEFHQPGDPPIPRRNPATRPHAIRSETRRPPHN